MQDKVSDILISFSQSGNRSKKDNGDSVLENSLPENDWKEFREFSWRNSLLGCYGVDTAETGS